jgi:hypothetical protein
MSIINDLFRYGIPSHEKLNLVWWEYINGKVGEKNSIGPPYGIVRRVILNEDGAQRDNPALNAWYSASPQHISDKDANLGVKVDVEIPTITDNYINYIERPEKKDSVFATFRRIDIDRDKYNGRIPSTHEIIKLKYANPRDLEEIVFDGYPSTEQLIDPTILEAKKNSAVKSKHIFNNNKTKGAK